MYSGVKILHTADLHLESSFFQIDDAEKRNERRRDLLEVFKKICTFVKQEKVNLVLISGDIFEKFDGGNPDTVNFVINGLEGLSPIKVFITPGNHDPLVYGSPYVEKKWPANVYIFKTNSFEMVELQDLGVRIYGIANAGFMDETNYLEGLKLQKSKEEINIVMLHGTYADDLPAKYIEEAVLPFTKDDLCEIGAHYYALGHYHELKELKITTNQNKPAIACYPGCPEGRGHDEEGKKVSLFVEISDHIINIKQIPTGIKKYLTIPINCDGVTTKDEIVNRIKSIAIPDWENSIVRICLEGEYHPDLSIDLEYINQQVRNLFYFVKISTLKDGFHAKYNLDELRIQKNVVGEFVRKIESKIAQIRDEREKTVLNQALYYGLDSFYRAKIEERFMYSLEEIDANKKS